MAQQDKQIPYLTAALQALAQAGTSQLKLGVLKKVYDRRFGHLEKQDASYGLLAKWVKQIGAVDLVKLFHNMAIPQSEEVIRYICGAVKIDTVGTARADAEDERKKREGYITTLRGKRLDDVRPEEIDEAFNRGFIIETDEWANGDRFISNVTYGGKNGN